MENHYEGGDFLHQLRKERGYTRRELGTMLGVTGKTVAKWETGTAVPQSEILPQLSVVLGCTREELLSGRRSERTNAQDITAEYREIVKRCSCCRHEGLRFQSLLSSAEVVEKGAICKDCGAELRLEERKRALISMGTAFLRYILSILIWVFVETNLEGEIIHLDMVKIEWIRRICVLVIIFIINCGIESFLLWLIGKLAPYRKYLRIVRYPHPEDGKIVL